MLTRLCTFALFATALTAQGAAAQFYQRVDTHFGVVATRDATTGTTTSQPLVGTALTLGWQGQMDNGLRLGFEVELNLRNSPRPDNPYRDQVPRGPRGTATLQFP